MSVRANRDAVVPASVLNKVNADVRRATVRVVIRMETIELFE